MQIYPKGSQRLEQCDYISHYINKYNGVEIQMFEDENFPKRTAYNIDDVIENVVIKFPDIKEVFIHLPLKDCYLEEIFTLNPDRLLDEAVLAANASKVHGIKIGLVYHTALNSTIITKTLEDLVYKMLSIIRRHEVTLYIENVVYYRGGDLPPIILCEAIDHPQLKMCLDTTHFKIQANMHLREPHEYMREILSSLDPKSLEKHIGMVHFAQAINNDGYRDHKTHGRRHENEEELRKDIELLREYGIKNPIWVTEVSEDDYSNRPDQNWELETLEKNL